MFDFFCGFWGSCNILPTELHVISLLTGLAATLLGKILVSGSSVFSVFCVITEVLIDIIKHPGNLLVLFSVC